MAYLMLLILLLHNTHILCMEREKEPVVKVKKVHIQKDPRKKQWRQ